MILSGNVPASTQSSFLLLLSDDDKKARTHQCVCTEVSHNADFILVPLPLSARVMMGDALLKGTEKVVTGSKSGLELSFPKWGVTVRCSPSHDECVVGVMRDWNSVPWGLEVIRALVVKVRSEYFYVLNGNVQRNFKQWSSCHNVYRNHLVVY